MNPELSQLISLQDVDVEIKRLKSEIDSLPARREQLEGQFAAENKEFLDLKQQADDAQSKKRSLEEELNDEQQKTHDFILQGALICVFKGPQHIYEIANDKYKRLLGKRDFIGKPIREVISAAEGAGYFELLDQVYTSGVSFVGNESPVTLENDNEEPQLIYVNFVYQPSRDVNNMVDGILVHGVEVTDYVLAKRNLQQSSDDELTKNKQEAALKAQESRAAKEEERKKKQQAGAKKNTNKRRKK